MSDLEGRLDRLERDNAAFQREFRDLKRQLEWALKAETLTPLPPSPIFPDDADIARALTGTIADLYPVGNDTNYPVGNGTTR